MARFGLGLGLWQGKTNFTSIPLNVNFTCIKRGDLVAETIGYCYAAQSV